MVLTNLAYAIYPGSIARESFAYSNNGAGGPTSGPNFDGSDPAAMYGCQALHPIAFYSGHKILSSQAQPANGPVGVNVYGFVQWNVTCSATNNANKQLYTANYNVLARPECNGGGSIINNYAPITCTGEPYTPPVACVNTQNAVITAFHGLPTVPQGCYAGCMYSATQVAVADYNGVQYETGSWTGNGNVCENTSTALIGGVPGNPQNVGVGGGLKPSDLVGLATEQTLQNLLSLVQNAAGTNGQNQAILQSIEANTKAIADKPAGAALDTADPDGFEQTYKERILENPDVEGGALVTRPKETFNVGGTFTGISGFMNASCPTGPSFSIKGMTYKFDLGPLCTLATGISYMVVALATMSGVKIFVSGAYA